ncbi:Predicted PurR-regulated permease PerM [Monaibacterium marinum]|uniref:Predicted PurR-regulated permease PerM n=1 Tax=Pontivivens marinum TaxID=1690039 RepID=A0A2C9CM54_9RHOB|nr:AI-2E family transporter [Monaibacterium marinum]SOH92446.1 Predicted PurR-regulated permease PerM [Monaibacterium marinum]
MALSRGEQLRYWGVGAAIFIGFLWVVGDTLLPFLVGMTIAYFLDPVADRLERLGFSRVLATVVITIGVLLGAILVLVILIPVAIDQTQSLIAAAPGYADTLQSFLQERFPELLVEGSVLRDAIDTTTEAIRSRIPDIANSILASGIAVLDFVLVLVVAPVVAFYMLMDWDRMVAKIDGWLPREHRKTIRDLACRVDSVLAGFVRGQLTVCLILGGFYAMALTLIGLQFGLVIGLFAGLVSFIPFVGSIMGGALSIGVALFQFWDQPLWIAAVAAIFVVGQAVEGNVLTPKLVGGSVGLHPVWLMFALSAFGAIMGFTGLLIAVPVAAVIGVLARFAIDKYMEGRLYRGPEDQDGAG